MELRTAPCCERVSKVSSQGSIGERRTAQVGMEERSWAKEREARERRSETELTNFILARC